MEENKDSLDKIEAELQLALEPIVKILVEVFEPIFEALVKCFEIVEIYILDNEKEIIKDNPELKPYINYLKNRRLKDGK